MAATLSLVRPDASTRDLASRLDKLDSETTLRLTDGQGRLRATIKRLPFRWEITAIGVSTVDSWSQAVRCGCCTTTAGSRSNDLRRWDITCRRGRDRVLWRLLKLLGRAGSTATLHVVPVAPVAPAVPAHSLAHTPPHDLHLENCKRGPLSPNYYDVNYHVGGE